MGRVERLVHRAGRHLAAGEVVLGSAVGTEVGGRRGRVVLLTDDRLLLVTPLRAGKALELSLRASTATFDADAGVLTLREGETEVALRDVDVSDGRQVVELLEQRHARAEAPYMEYVPHVRILGE